MPVWGGRRGRGGHEWPLNDRAVSARHRHRHGAGGLVNQIFLTGAREVSFAREGFLEKWTVVAWAGERDHLDNAHIPRDE